ncbi:MAG: glycosyltransferase [Ignavibacteriales bacterium]|nr:glycosyltransferase [Ignavibacteriales bacterium]
MSEITSFASNQSDEKQIGFSIVIPSFNQGEYISETIDSLLNQHYPDLEIIVIDGGSTDNTVDILRGYGDRIRYISEKDNGQSDALVKGFKMASKEWLAWLNSDDVQSNNALWKVGKSIKEHPETQVVVGLGHYMDKSGNFLRPYPTIEIGSNGNPTKELFEKGYLAQPSVFFRRDIYIECGGVNDKLQFVMDYELWARFAIAGYRFLKIPEDISGNRWHETAKTASQLLPLLSEVANVQTKEFGKVSPYFVQAISDHLYGVFHSKHFGDKHHIFYRTIYFKSVWLWMNIRKPSYCIKGLLTENICKSGPVVGDKLTYSEILSFGMEKIKNKIKPVE